MARKICGVVFDTDMGEAAKEGIIETSNRYLVTSNVNKQPNRKKRRKRSTESNF